MNDNGLSNLTKLSIKTDIAINMMKKTQKNEQMKSIFKGSIAGNLKTKDEIQEKQDLTIIANDVKRFESEIDDEKKIESIFIKSFIEKNRSKYQNKSNWEIYHERLIQVQENCLPNHKEIINSLMNSIQNIILSTKPNIKKNCLAVTNHINQNLDQIENNHLSEIKKEKYEQLTQKKFKIIEENKDKIKIPIIDIQKQGLKTKYNNDINGIIYGTRNSNNKIIRSKTKIKDPPLFLETDQILEYRRRTI